MQERVKKQNLRIAELETQIKDLTQSTLNIDSLAGKRVPYSYVIPITIDQGSEQLAEGSTQTSRSGPFFAEKLICTFRINSVEAGGAANWVGVYLPLSSRWSYPWIWNAGANPSYVPPLDFEFGWESSSSDRQRQDKFIPGDVLDRCDSDGILAVSDIFPQGSTITFKVNPLRPVGNNVPWNAGTGVHDYIFTAVFWGYKIIQPTQV
jgi:hypothetical protein